MIHDSKYINHKVFDQLPEYAKFYENLSFLIMGCVTQGTKAIINIDTYLFTSIQGTLESIKDILIKGRINDSYALLRKYHDSIIINIYSNLYLNDNFSIDNFVVQKIDNWIKGKEQLPEFRIMSQYIRNSKKLKTINNLLYKDKIYKGIRERCNDHTHYNYFKNVLLNDNKIFLENRLESLNSFSDDLLHIFILHFSYLFSLKDRYMMSSDYVDSSDCGYTPEEGSQYYVAPFIQEIFDTKIKENRMDLAKEIKRRTSMLLE